ncbi:MAG: HAMP domain-containing histidine kinase [Firmicutes bacterium]|nr:HAMP domain-containing histidine kinase [Bacillota bacterium]
MNSKKYIKSINEKNQKSQSTSSQSTSGHTGLEDTAITIKDLSKRKKPKTIKEAIMLVLKILTAPLLIIPFVLGKYFARRKARRAAKTTAILAIIFALLIIVYVVFVIVIVDNYLPEDALNNLVILIAIGAIIIMIAFLIAASALSALISSTLFKPVRTMATQIGEISYQDLSIRLSKIDFEDELHELVEQINQMLDRLEKSFAAQADFIANASHELKTPLAVIGGYVSILDRWGKDDKSMIEEGVAAIKRECTHIQRMVDQMLTLAGIDGFEIEREDFEIGEEVKNIVDGYVVINSEIVFKKSDDFVLSGDKTLFVAAVRAIIDNAIKYGEGKQICIEAGALQKGIDKDIDELASQIVQKNQSGQKANIGVIKIKDNGVGIDQKDLPFIFDRFYRCDKTRGRNKGSAGLGLSICKDIVKLFGGKVAAKSKKGRGSEFYLLFGN